MEPANDPIPSDRLQPGARVRGGSLHGCVQAWLETSPAPDEEARLTDALLRLRPLPVLEAAARLATALEPGVTVLVQAGGDVVAVPDRELVTIARSRPLPPQAAVRLACPGPESVESEDIRAIAAAVRGGLCPLRADVRITWSLVPMVDGVEMRAIDACMTIPLVAEAIARYAAEQLEEARQDVAPPEAELVRRLLDRTGGLRIRPVETQVWAGFLEIGVGTDVAGQERPCDTTLIYDRPSGTWHMEP